MKEKIRIKFSDFWGGFNYDPTKYKVGDNTLFEILSERYDIEISDNPDFLIFSVFGNSHQRYNCTKIFYTGENIRPNYETCDYSISFDYLDDERNFRFPLSAMILYENGIKNKFPKVIDIEDIKLEKTKFCNFVFSNPSAPLRNTLLSELSKYKKVDSGGRALNNIGYFVDNKLNFLSEYKFTIAFENSEHNGYTTEKIVHPKLVNSIPLYYGNPLVSKDWNTKSFISLYDFDDIYDMIEYIKEMDNDDGLYHKMLQEPHFTNDTLPFDFQTNNLLDFFDNIFKNKKQPCQTFQI